MPATKAITVKSYHGIGWDIRPGSGYARKKPDAIKLAIETAIKRGAKRVLVYKDSGELQRTIIIREQTQ